MDSPRPDALSASFASDDRAMAALREFSESIMQDLPTMVGVCVHPLARDCDGVTALGSAADSMDSELTEWTCSFGTPRDAEYLEYRRGVGRRHCALGLPRELVIATFGRFREQLLGSAMSWPRPLDERLGVLTAISRELDLELALVLQGYIECEQRNLTSGEHSSATARLSVSLGHELRNPLATIETSAYLIAQRLIRLGIADEGIDRHLDKIRRHVQLCSGIISDLLGKEP